MNTVMKIKSELRNVSMYTKLSFILQVQCLHMYIVGARAQHMTTNLVHYQRLIIITNKS